jgi:hypothetical protein
MKMMSNDSPDMPNGVQPTNNYVPVEKPKESEPKTTKVRRKSSTTKAKVSTPTTPKNFVPAKAIGNAPPPRTNSLLKHNNFIVNIDIIPNI